jgi:hypothetical protein
MITHIINALVGEKCDLRSKLPHHDIFFIPLLLPPLLSRHFRRHFLLKYPQCASFPTGDRRSLKRAFKALKKLRRIWSSHSGAMLKNYKTITVLENVANYSPNDLGWHSQDWIFRWRAVKDVRPCAISAEICIITVLHYHSGVIIRPLIRNREPETVAVQ